jgi:hypothetical protein
MGDGSASIFKEMMTMMSEMSEGEFSMVGGAKPWRLTDATRPDVEDDPCFGSRVHAKDHKKKSMR